MFSKVRCKLLAKINKPTARVYKKGSSMWRLEASRIVEWSWRKTENCDTKLSTNFIHCAPKNWVNFSIILFFVSPLTFWRFRSLSAKQEEEEERERVGGRERAEQANHFIIVHLHMPLFLVYFLFFVLFFSVCTLRHYLIFIRVCARTPWIIVRGAHCELGQDTDADTFMAPARRTEGGD